MLLVGRRRKGLVLYPDTRIFRLEPVQEFPERCGIAGDLAVLEDNNRFPRTGPTILSVAARTQYQ